MPSHTALQCHAISLSVLLFHLLPPEYTIEIEITLRNPDLFSLVTQYYKCHNLQISTNISGVEMSISSINVTAGGLVVYFSILADMLVCQYVVSPSFNIHHT